MLVPEEGVKQQQEFVEPGLLRQQALAQRLQSITTLQALTQDYEIFSHAALLLYGQLAGDPVQTWYNAQTRSDIVISPLRFDYQVVDGVGQWNNTLWLCERDAWSDLCRFLAGIGAWNPGTGRFWLSKLQRLVITDPLVRQHAAVQPTVLPRIPVTFFGISATEANRVWQQGKRFAVLERYPPEAVVALKTQQYQQQGGISDDGK